MQGNGPHHPVLPGGLQLVEMPVREQERPVPALVEAVNLRDARFWITYPTAERPLPVFARALPPSPPQEQLRPQAGLARLAYTLTFRTWLEKSTAPKPSLSRSIFSR